MAQLSQLLSRLPDSKEVHMSTMGHVLWVCWHNNLAPAVNQTFLNYGGMLVGEEREQALWFFFTDDVFLALARLKVWGNFNELSVGIELFPGRLQLSKAGTNISIDSSLLAQEILVKEALEIWVHPKSYEDHLSLPGITFASTQARQGMAIAAWATMVVDVRMPFASTQAWFAILHPLGSPLDKAFQAGWPNMFHRIDGMLQKHKIKSIVHENFVMLAVDNLLMLRTFLRDYLQTFSRDNNDDPEAIWPCACVVADRNNLNFNNDLPKKIGLQWDNLMPDVPYISYRNAYLLGEGFTVRDLKFTGEQVSMDAWCNVLLNEDSISSRSIPLIMAALLTSGTSGQDGCFYCGIPSHGSAECPTRTYFPSRHDIWDDVGNLGLDQINSGFRKIEKVLAQSGLHGYEELLEGEDEASLVLQAVLDLNGPCQLRNVPRNWLYRLREPEPDEKEPSKDDSPAWDLLDELVKCGPGELNAFEKKLDQAITRHQRDPRLRTVRGFLCLEKKDFGHAASSFKEAASLTPSPALQAWNDYLQARLNEELGHYTVAIELYNQVWRVMPQWLEVRYRGIVCRVKMGFAEQVLTQINDLVEEAPSFFNRVLIDPALERGRLLILASLYDLWAAAKTRADEDTGKVYDLQNRLKAWFPQDHPVFLQTWQKLEKLEALSNVENYIAFLDLVARRPAIEKELDENIQREVDELRNRYKHYLDILQEIRDEASWFPFPSVLRDFSSDFNECAGIINWAFACNFNEAETFLRAQSTLPRLNELLRNLKKRLKFLCMVRDATLFGLTMGKTFIWVEIIGLVLCFLGIPIVVFWGDSLHLGWLRILLGENQWSIQKVLAIIVTIIAIGIGALRTTLVFEHKREKLLKEAREQREKAQEMRLERIRKQRQMEAENARREQKAEEEREMHRELRERMRG